MLFYNYESDLDQQKKSQKIFEIVQAQQNISPNVSSQLSLNDKTFYKSIFKVPGRTKYFAR